MCEIGWGHVFWLSSMETRCQQGLGLASSCSRIPSNYLRSYILRVFGQVSWGLSELFDNVSRLENFRCVIDRDRQAFCLWRCEAYPEISTCLPDQQLSLRMSGVPRIRKLRGCALLCTTREGLGFVACTFCTYQVFAVSFPVCMAGRGSSA